MSPVRSFAETWGQESWSEAGWWQRLLVLDAWLLLFARRCETVWLTPLMRGLTQLGDTGAWLLLALIFAGLGGDGPRYALLLVSAALTALTVSQGLKRVCKRPRPSEAGLADFASLAPDPDAFSFPSGHTAVAFAVAVALSGEGLALHWVLLPLAGGIGTSRVYLGAHYPLDVALGALIGGLSGLLARGLL